MLSLHVDGISSLLVLLYAQKQEHIYILRQISGLNTFDF